MFHLTFTTTCFVVGLTHYEKDCYPYIKRSNTCQQARCVTSLPRLQLISKAPLLLVQWFGHSYSGQKPQQQTEPIPTLHSKSLLQDVCAESLAHGLGMSSQKPQLLKAHGRSLPHLDGILAQTCSRLPVTNIRTFAPGTARAGCTLVLQDTNTHRHSLRKLYH